MWNAGTEGRQGWCGGSKWHQRCQKWCKAKILEETRHWCDQVTSWIAESDLTRHDGLVQDRVDLGDPGLPRHSHLHPLPLILRAGHPRPGPGINILCCEVLYSSEPTSIYIINILSWACKIFLPEKVPDWHLASLWFILSMNAWNMPMFFFLSGIRY